MLSAFASIAHERFGGTARWNLTLAGFGGVEPPSPLPSSGFGALAGLEPEGEPQAEPWA